MNIYAKSDNEVTAYVNAKIYSGENLLENADGILVKDGKFFKLGASTDLKNQATKTIDLQGALVLPGFIESHGHFLGLGQKKLNLDLKNLQVNDIVERISSQAKKQRPNTWITGRGWDQNLWPDRKFPHKNSFSKIAHPVYLRRVDGHAIWVNDAALKIAKVTAETKDPDGGQILRDKNGEPTGVFIDNAISLVSSYLDKPDRKDLELYLDLATTEALSVGITSFHDAGVSKDVIDLYEDFAKSNRLKLRIYAMLDGEEQKLVEDFYKRGPVNINDFLNIRSIKYFADGALGSRGAYLLHDYHDQPGHRGLLLMNQRDLTEKTKRALSHGFQVATHAIGDGANRMVLDAYQNALVDISANDPRLRIEHAQIIDQADHARFKKLSVIASMQPIHCTSDMPWVPERLSPTRIHKRAYPWRSLLNNGVHLAFGSDGPVEEINPILGIYAAVTRTTVEGAPVNGFMPEEKLTLKEAFNGYFFGGAHAEFNETKKGKIAAGYFADFVVFDVDLLHPFKSSFLSAKPKMTVVNGDVVYKR